MRIGINGFGRIGRLVLRAGWPLECVRINDPAGDAATFAHLLNFDSVHGRWTHETRAGSEQLLIGDRGIAFSRNAALAQSDWRGCDVVIEASGKFKTRAALQDYHAQGVARVVVTAPVTDAEVLNVVMGVNHGRYDPAMHRVVTA